MSDQPGISPNACHHSFLGPGPGPHHSAQVGFLAYVGSFSCISYACLIPTGFRIWLAPPPTHLFHHWDRNGHAPSCPSTPASSQQSWWGGRSCCSFTEISPLLGPVRSLPSSQPWTYCSSSLNHLKPPHHLCTVNTWWQIVTVAEFGEKRKNSRIKVELSAWKSLIKLTWILDSLPLYGMTRCL